MALCLSRKKNEMIRIGDDITIAVMSIEGTRVRLAIDAPAEVPVHREEIYIKLRKDRQVD